VIDNLSLKPVSYGFDIAVTPHLDALASKRLLINLALPHDWWTPEGLSRIPSGTRHVREIKATTSFIQRRVQVGRSRSCC